ncbi:MAG: NAD-dependent epimerase/dehydratase family protein [Chitinophagaceae bacterium]
MRQTILGANGTIGKLLARELTTYTNQIRLVSRNPQKINETDELFAADLSNPELVDAAIEGSEVVYLVVGFDYSIKVWRDKWPTLMKATIASCIKRKTKLVFFDNVYLYDIEAMGHMTEASPIKPASKKGMVRMEIAEMIMKEVNVGSLTALIARAPDFYGPDNEKSFLIETVFKNIQKGKRPNWFVDAGKKHSFIYTPDAAKATALLGNTPEAFNQVWHLPTDKNTLTGREWVALFNKEMNTSKKVIVLPMFVLKLLGIFVPLLREMPEMMYQYDRDYFFDSSKFDQYFGFASTTYEMGVRQIVNH